MKAKLVSLLLVLSMITTTFGAIGTENTDDNYCGCNNSDPTISKALCDPPNINGTYYLGLNESIRNETFFEDGPEDSCDPRFDTEGFPSRFDWRDPDHNPTGRCCVTPIRDQSACGSCWAFATVAPVESKIMIQHGFEFDIAERWLVSNCCSAGDCNGGWWAFGWYKKDKSDKCNDFGIVPEDELPYGEDGVYGGPCECDLSFLYKIDKWAYVNDRYGVAPTKSIKQAIMDHGPVAAAVHVDFGWQFYYLPTAYNGVSGTPNHGVTIVGWDDDVGPHGSWIIKNSWGSLWGCRAGYGLERGYMYLQYGTAKIGYAAAYVGNVLSKDPHPSGKPKIIIDIDKVGYEDDIDFFIPPASREPEWYYELTVTDEDGSTQTVKQENKILDDDTYDWNKEYTWDLSADLDENNAKRHRYFFEINGKTADISVKLMDADSIWTEGGFDDLADISPVSDPDYEINPLTGLGSYDNVGSSPSKKIEDKTVFRTTYNIWEQSSTSLRSSGSDDGSTNVDQNDAYIEFSEISDNYDLPVGRINVTPARAIKGINRTFKADKINGSHGPFEYQWDFSYDGNTFNVDDTGEEVIKKWDSTGIYTVGLRIKDKLDWYSQDIATADITVEENIKPDVPTVIVPSEDPVESGTHKFIFNVTDPNGECDKIYYQYELIEVRIINKTLKTSEWFGPYEPGVEKKIKIWLYDMDTTYAVKARAKDLSGDVGDWSQGFVQPTPKVKSKDSLVESFFIQLLKFLFIKNHPIFEYLMIKT